MSSHPQISVVIPLYNKRDTVERALRSVLAQTVQDFEIVVVNDGSTDGSADVVRGINDPRIRLIEQPNAGVSAARNRGVAEARKDLIAFLDADDEWLPEFLQAIAELHARFPQCSVFATRYCFASADGRRWNPIIRGIVGDAAILLDDYFGIAARSDPPVWSSAVGVRKKALLAVGGFPEGITAGEDLLTWARLACRCKIAYSQRIMSVYHLGCWAHGVPPRPPDLDDRVGRGLLALKNADGAGPHRRSLCRYIGWWHKTRTSLFLRLGRKRLALLETLKGLSSWPTCPALYFYLFAALLPSAVFNTMMGARAASQGAGAGKRDANA